MPHHPIFPLTHTLGIGRKKRCNFLLKQGNKTIILFRCLTFLFILLFGYIPSPATANELNYPDIRTLTGINGFIKVDLLVEGTFSNEDGQTTAAKIAAGGNISQDEHGSTLTKFCKGTVKISHEDGTSTGTVDFSDQIFGGPELSLYVSKEKGKAHFYVSHGIIGSSGFPTRIVYVSDGYQHVEESIGQFEAFIPSYGKAPTFNGPFAFMLEDGIIQGPWDGRHLSGSYTVPVLAIVAPDGTFQAFPAEIGSEPGFKEMDLIPGRITVNWSLGEKPVKGKMVIKPVTPSAYENWIPAPKDGKYGGGVPVAFKAEIKPKDGQKEKPKGRIDFYLRDISKNKGTCTNYSEKSDGGKEKENDLRFAENQPDNISLDEDDPLHAYTDDDVTEAVVLVEATDTGAYGTLQAVCDELDLISEDERTKEKSIAVPLDDNDNHVADAWERERGIFNKDYETTWDEDAIPAGQYGKGDGYTLYEEYRGFMTKQGFSRTDPTKKDFFVYDMDGMVKQFYQPYNPAQLELHYIDTEMMRYSGNKDDPENRWVNYNSDTEHWYARQYALVVKRGKLNGNDAGAAYFSGSSFPDNQSLKHCYMIEIIQERFDELFAGLNRPDMASEWGRIEMTITLIHEIGHALGIQHHTQNGLEEENISDDDNGEYAGHSENWDHKSTGVLNCAMRYHNSAEMANPDLLAIPDTILWKR